MLVLSGSVETSEYALVFQYSPQDLANVSEWKIMYVPYNVSLCVRKPTICMGENKDADQLRSNCEADQRLCFRYTDSTFPPLLIPKFSRFWVSSVTVQAGLCRTWSEPKSLVFSCTGSCVCDHRTQQMSLRMRKPTICVSDQV